MDASDLELVFTSSALLGTTLLILSGIGVGARLRIPTRLLRVHLPFLRRDDATATPVLLGFLAMFGIGGLVGATLDQGPVDQLLIAVGFGVAGASTALGIFLGTISRSMAQFALLIILVIVVLMLLSGGSTPVESQPKWMQHLTYFLPARHFVSFSQVIIYRGGGLSAVWSQFLMVGAIGLAFFVYSLGLFRKSIAVSK